VTSSVNPEEERLQELDLDLIVSGTDEAILMVEAGANGVTEAEILDALDIAHSEIKKLVVTMEQLPREGRQGEARDRASADRREALRLDSGLTTGNKLSEATQVPAKLERHGRDRCGRA